MACLHPIKIPNPKYKHQKDIVLMEVPCKRCIACRVNRSREWSLRMVHEARFHDQIMFITLTYDNEHIEHTNLETGEITPDLSKRDAQLFLKRLRFQIEKIYHKKIRYYLCGEYGGLNGRPHYHAILFGIGKKVDINELWNPNLKAYNQRFKEYSDLKKIVRECWGNGMVDIDDRTAGIKSCEYVAKYIQKFDNREIPEHWQPEFSIFSKGLGREWLKKYGDDLKKEGHEGRVWKGGYWAPVPKYYLEKIYTNEELKEVKEKNTPEYLKILQAHEKNGSGLPSVIASAERDKNIVRVNTLYKLEVMGKRHEMYQIRKKI